MRVVTTAPKFAIEPDGYANRWLDGRKHWSADFYWYTEGYQLPYAPDELQMIEQAGTGSTAGWINRKDFSELAEFSEWKAKHQGYVPPAWQWDVVRYAHKVFAAIDALYDYDGIGVWLDADCVTFKAIPDGLIERQVEGVYLAHYGRTGLYTETGFWIVDCAHPQHREFLDTMRGLYLTERYRQLAQWHDCFVLDASIRLTGVPTHNLSGEFHKDMHPMAKTELGQYIDHCKGPRKIKGKSPENKHR